KAVEHRFTDDLIGKRAWLVTAGAFPLVPTPKTEGSFRIAAALAIHRQHDRGGTGGFGALHESLGHVPVVGGVKHVPHGGAVRLAHILDSSVAHRGQDELMLALAGGRGHCPLGGGVECAQAADRTEINRAPPGFAEDFYAGVDLARIDQSAYA